MHRLARAFYAHINKVSIYMKTQSFALLDTSGLAFIRGIYANGTITQMKSAVVECLTQDRVVAGLSLTGGTTLCP